MNKVFLSSTSRDLANYRQAVYECIESIDGYHCVRMEAFGARDSSAPEFDRRKIQECDLFVGIVGQSYGSSPKAGHKSFTQMEYETAVAMGKPRLMFLSAPETLRNLDAPERPDRLALQEGFRRYVAEDRVVATFSSPLDLATKVVSAIFNHAREESEEHPSKEISDFVSATVPRPPSPHFPHSYALQQHFKGRLSERKMLTNWLCKDPRRLLVLVGIGGLGKSALAWVWLHNDVLGHKISASNTSNLQRATDFAIPQEKRPEGFFWWSFYETNATFPEFLNEALTYVSAGSLQPERIPSSHFKTRMLVTLLQQHRMLFILDGFERLLKAYVGLAGAYKGDLPVVYPSTQSCACVDPTVAKFLVWIASPAMSTRVLLTSRLFPAELQSFGDSTLAGCRREDLDSLAQADAIALFRAMSISGTSDEINQLCSAYGYHPLTLRILAGYIANHLSQPGAIQVAFDFDPLSRLVPKHHNILDVAYDAVDQKQKDLLARIAAFRSPVPYNAVKALASFEKDDQLQYAMQDLIERGLILHQRKRGLFDLHPIVRRYCYERLSDKQAVHKQIRDFFTLASPEPKDVRSIDELSPTIELFHHTLRSGLYDQAFELYVARLWSHFEKLGAYRAEIEILESFLPQGVDTELKLTPKNSDYLFDYLGVDYGFIGQPRKAVQLLSKAVEIKTEYAGEHNTYVPLGSIVFFKMQVGELQKAEEYQQKVLRLAKAANDFNDVAYSQMRLGLILAYTGRYAEAIEEFRAARFEFRKEKDTQGECHLWSYRVIRAQLIGDIPLSVLCARRAFNYAHASDNKRQIARSKMLLASALIHLADSTPLKRANCTAEARALLEEALLHCRELETTHIEVNVHLNWARWYRLNDEPIRSKESAEKALSMANDAEYRLQQADIHNFLSEMALADNDKSAARKHAEIAKERAYCDGPPHCYKKALDTTEQILATLHPPLPNLS